MLTMHTPRTLTTFMHGLWLMAGITSGVLLLIGSAQAQAVRCVNASGVVVAYAESAAYCPKTNTPAGTVDTTSTPTTAQTTQAKQQAVSTQKQADALENQRLAQERAQAKANAVASKRSAAKEKTCKRHALAVEEASSKADDARRDTLKKSTAKTPKTPKTSTPKTSQSNPQSTATRVDDEPKTAKYQKAKRKLAQTQAKHDLDCKP